MKKISFRDGAARIRGYLRDFLSRNLGLKLLSVVCAVCLWSYVIATNPDITRDKLLGDVSITVTGQSVLEDSRGLAMLTNAADIGSVRVKVRVPQASYNLVSSDNVRVELDLSNIRQTGKQSVKLRGTSTYGSIVEVSPQYVELEIENRDQRYVPVNVTLAGGKEDYWYSVARVNPAQVTVSGPTSQVQTVSSAQISLDMTDRSESYISAENLVLLDTQGNEVPWKMSLSSSSATVAVDAYPTRTLPVAQEMQELITGRTPDGYQVDSVEVSPAYLTVAADESLLESLQEIAIEPISITSARQTFTAVARVRQLSDIKNLSAQNVSVTVNISEQTLTKRFSNVLLSLLNQPEGVRCESASNRISVRVDGPYSVVRNLNREDIQASVDVGNRAPGQYVLPVRIEIDNRPELTAAAVPAEVSVTVSSNTISE